MTHEVISYRGSFVHSPAGSARHCSSFFLATIARGISLGRRGSSSSYLVGQGQAELDLSVVAKSVRAPSGAARDSTGRGLRATGATCLVVDGLGVASSLQRGPDGGRARSEGCTGGDAEGVHDGWWTN